MAKGNFFSELKRRNVYRVGAAYVVAAFVLIEVASNVAPALRLPDWTTTLVIVLLALGFPVLLCFAWIYEVTPEGVKRTVDVEQDASVTHQTGHRLNIVIIGLMVILAGLYGAQLLLVSDEAADQRAGSAVAPGSISIAVLPFVNLSGDPNQEFFSDGMTEEITSALAKVKGLQVVGRTSAFEFKGQNKDLNAIGKALRATHLLEGSVRKSGNRVRITGQLIRADTGTHLWTENYDRELTDIFATQDDIAKAIAGALQVPLGIKPGSTLIANRTISPEGYQQYLRAKAAYRARGQVGRDGELEAVSLLEPIVVAEPDYAPAWALLASAYHRSPQSSAAWKESGGVQDGQGDAYEELRTIAEAARAKARIAAQRALDLDPGNAEGYAALGLAQPFVKLQIREDLLRQAFELEPSNPDVLHDYSVALADVGRVKQAVALRQKLLSIEPLVPVFNSNTALIFWLDGQNDAALAVLKDVPNTRSTRSTELGEIYASMGRYADAADAILSAPSESIPAVRADVLAQLLRKAPAKIPTQDLPILNYRESFVYIHLGAPERAALWVDVPVGLRFFWLHPSYAAVRKTERFKDAARKYGLVEYWRARGWPDICRPVGADDFECD